jgi:hypothetical protein
MVAVAAAVAAAEVVAAERVLAWVAEVAARRCRGRRRRSAVRRLSGAVARDRIRVRIDLRPGRSAAVRERDREPARSAGIDRGLLHDPAASVREDRERASPEVDDRMPDN